MFQHKFESNDVKSNSQDLEKCSRQNELRAYNHKQSVGFVNRLDGNVQFPAYAIQTVGKGMHKLQKCPLKNKEKDKSVSHGIKCQLMVFLNITRRKSLLISLWDFCDNTFNFSHDLYRSGNLSVQPCDLSKNIVILLVAITSE